MEYTFFRSEDNETFLGRNYPDHRTKLVKDFKQAFVKNLINDDRTDLGLEWVGVTDAEEISSYRPFGYNEFDLHRFADTLKRFGMDKAFYLGREGSMVAYLPVGEYVADKIAEATHADECDEDDNGFYRLWWD